MQKLTPYGSAKYTYTNPTNDINRGFIISDYSSFIEKKDNATEKVGFSYDGRSSYFLKGTNMHGYGIEYFTKENYSEFGKRDYNKNIKIEGFFKDNFPNGCIIEYDEKGSPVFRGFYKYDTNLKKSIKFGFGVEFINGEQVPKIFS